MVIGLDAATWNLIKPWADEGKLPTIKKLMTKGSWGELESSIPFFSSPAWKCYSTGKNPGKLGAFAWFNFDRKTKEIRFNTSTSFKGKEIWDYLGESGVKCGIINMPLTFPPKQVNGFMISGGPARDWSNYTYPRELREILVKRYNYEIEPEHSLSSNKDKAILELKKLVKNQFRIAKNLFKSEEIDFLHLTIFSTDEIQHFLWHDMETNNEKYGKVIEDFWAMIDAEIGELLGQVDNKTYIIVMSDHGFTALKGSFHVNMWLRDKGYLHLKKFNLFSVLSVLGLTQDRITRLLKLIRIDKVLKRTLSAEKSISVRHQFPSSKGEMEIPSVIKSIDWSKTKAITVGETCIYINLPQDSNEYEEFREKLVKEIKNIVDPMTEEVIFNDVKRREEVYEGEFSSIAPNLLIIPNDGYRPLDSMTKKHFWDYSKEGWSGYHKLCGVFIACGPSIKGGFEIKNARIYDMAPTILYLCGLPVPNDMDGRVLEHVFKEEFLKEHPIRYQRAKEEIRTTKKERLPRNDEEEMKERLRKLGYIS